MAVQSINTLQNKDNYNNIAKEYILESLANLGQRYNVKGDSISVNDFMLKDLFEFSGTEDLSEYVVVVTKQSDEHQIYLVNKNDISQPISNVLTTKDNVVIIDTLNITTNPYITYSNIGFKVSNLYFTMWGREDNNTALDKTNFFIERFDRRTNNLIEGIKVFKTHFNNFVNEKYLLVRLRLNDDFNYDISLYASKKTTEELSESELYTTISNIDFDNLDLSDMFDWIVNSECNYDGYKFSPDSGLLNYVGNAAEQEILENTLLISIAYDSNKLLQYVKSKFSTEEYGSIEAIYKKLLADLYDEIHNNSGLGKVYIPLIGDKNGNPYSITYTYNVNNPEQVYFAGREIEVRYVTEDIDTVWMGYNIDFYRGTIIVHTDGCAKDTFFYFETNIENDSILGIDVKKISTLPYIDNDGYWVINDISTPVKAKGQDAGNPNIIIVETVNNFGDYNILSGAKEREILSKLTWKPTIAKVEPLERINLDNLTFKNEYDYFNVCCSIPDLSAIPSVNKKEYLEHLDNSLIICISPVSCILYNSENSEDAINYTKDDIYEIYGEYGIITTLWTVNNSDPENPNFDYLRKRNNEYAAADFNYLSNINNLIQYAVKNTEPLHPDNFEFTRIVFDPTTTTLKNNTVEYRTYLYPTILNKLSGQYNISNYNNDLNFTFRYNDTIIKSNKDRNIESVTQSGEIKYFNTTYNDGENNSANIVTNSLYTYYTNGIYGKYAEYIPNYNVPSLDLSEVLTRNQTLLNRLNILTFDNTGTAYMSYVGTSFESDKNILTIGTSETNINLGTDTLIDENSRSSFVKQNVMNVDFPEVNVHGDMAVQNNLSVDENIYMNGAIWSKDYHKIKSEALITDTTYYTTIYTPSSRYIYELRDKFSNKNAYGIFNMIDEESFNEIMVGINNGIDYSETLNNISLYTNGLISYSLYEYAKNKNKLFVIGTIYERYNMGEDSTDNKSHMIYCGDGIYIPVLLSQLGFEKYISKKDNILDLSKVEITSNMELFKVNNNPIMVLSSSTNLLPDKYLYDANGEKITNFTYTIFTSNPLKITYYISGDRLNMNIEELYGKNKFTSFRKLNHNYSIV